MDCSSLVSFFMDNHSVLQMDGAVGEGSQSFVVGDDDESLSELVAEVEEELVELVFVLAVEAS